MHSDVGCCNDRRWARILALDTIDAEEPARMPGRRLTEADRRQIAEGLAQGLDYAGIARRLGRPTSTVSREVGRNGGPGRYRADLAHLATTHRGRRSPRPPAATQRAGERGRPDSGSATAFLSEFTAVLIETGMPRTAAGVMACLFTSETGSRTTAELAQHLQVSAATISHATGLLHRHGLIRRGHDGRSRRHRYFLDENAGLRSAVVGVHANQRLAATALRGADIFGSQTPVGTRLAAAGRFLELLGDDILRAAEKHWRTTQIAGGPPPPARVPGRSDGRDGRVHPEPGAHHSRPACPAET
jgi:hypothetical protein